MTLQAACRALLTAVFLCSAASNAADRPAADSVKVQVFHSTKRYRVEDVRVFVLGEDGKELASATTDSRGTARLPASLGAKPRYLLVEHPAFFMSGVRWREGLAEYYILVTALEQP